MEFLDGADRKNELFRWRWLEQLLIDKRSLNDRAYANYDGGINLICDDGGREGWMIICLQKRFANLKELCPISNNLMRNKLELIWELINLIWFGYNISMFVCTVCYMQYILKIGAYCTATTTRIEENSNSIGLKDASNSRCIALKKWKHKM